MFLQRSIATNSNLRVLSIPLKLGITKLSIAEDNLQYFVSTTRIELVQKKAMQKLNKKYFSAHFRTLTVHHCGKISEKYIYI